MASRTSRGNAGSRVSSSFRAGTSAAKSRRVAYYERPPVVMEWGCTLLRIGYAEQNQHRPQHTIVLRQPLPSLDSQEQEWYSFVAPLLQTAWDRLMLSSFLASSSSSSSSSGNTNTNARRVVCVHSPYLPRAWERAITQALWNLQVPSIALVHNVETVPIALGWKRGMVVHVGMDEAQCLAHVDGHPLRYTYQGKNTAVCVQVVPPFSTLPTPCSAFLAGCIGFVCQQKAMPCGYQKAVSSSNTIEPSWTNAMNDLWLEEKNPRGLVWGILQCLRQCPLEVRKDVVSNLVFCGDALLLVPGLPYRTSQRLQKLLSSQEEEEQQQQQQQADPPNDPATDGDEEEENNAGQLTRVAMDWKQLQPLASHVQATSTYPQPPELVAWVGASLWATVWHRHDDDDSFVQWTYR